MAHSHSPEPSKPPHQSDWYLRKEDIRNQLSPGELAMLAQHSTRHVLKKGELLWLDETEKPLVYVLDDGLAGLCKTDEEGRKYYLGLLTPGDVFGEVVPEHLETPVEDYLEVIRDARIIQIDAAVFHKIVMTHPPFLMRIMAIMSHRYHVLQKRLSVVLAKDVTARTAVFLLEFCEKLGKACPYEPDCIRDIQLTHQEIADLIYATRPVVSSVISDLTKAGFIHKHDNMLCLVNPDALLRVSEQGHKGLSGP